MKVIKKINNNIAIAVDGENNEVIVFAKGIGYGNIPYEIKDLSVIERTFYDVDNRYYGLLKEIPNNIFNLVTKMVDVAKKNIEDELSPNLVFILADHINFAIIREKNGMDISLPYSYELEYEYPLLTKISKWMVKKTNEELDTHLPKGEVTSITMHFINALEGTNMKMHAGNIENKISKVIFNVTNIVEKHFNFNIDKKSFNYFRFKNHLKYFVQRKEAREMFTDNNRELYESMIEKYPDTYDCISKIDNYFYQEYKEKCTTEELLYLLVHVNRLYIKEDCHRKGITPEK